ncbi:hypothetical protein EG68_07385 [Paragonimus skrjabini miyazakii]|uniref:Protein CASC3 n=1 Tax=Paragonimus skrjabini miyazakii TaxID=59628 RepID=A0A8S9YQ34_9TREM|nr:hypothetical protein EG68_07385 [Paragonimus skrjabini miyazakii]
MFRSTSLQLLKRSTPVNTPRPVRFSLPNISSLDLPFAKLSVAGRHPEEIPCVHNSLMNVKSPITTKSEQEPENTIDSSRITKSTGPVSSVFAQPDEEFLSCSDEVEHPVESVPHSRLSETDELTELQVAMGEINLCVSNELQLGDILSEPETLEKIGGSTPVKEALRFANAEPEEPKNADPVDSECQDVSASSVHDSQLESERMSPSVEPRSNRSGSVLSIPESPNESVLLDTSCSEDTCDEDALPGSRRRRAGGSDGSDILSTDSEDRDVLCSDSTHDASDHYSDAEEREVDVGSELELVKVSEVTESAEVANDLESIVKNDVTSSGTEVKLDADQDVSNPAYVPRTGTYFMHDYRAADYDKNAEHASVAKGRADQGKWQHDMFCYYDQAPLSSRDIIRRYGYDIRKYDEPVPEDRSNASDGVEHTASASSHSDNRQQDVRPSVIESGTGREISGSYEYPDKIQPRTSHQRRDYRNRVPKDRPQSYTFSDDSGHRFRHGRFTTSAGWYGTNRGEQSRDDYRGRAQIDSRGSTVGRGYLASRRQYEHDVPQNLSTVEDVRPVRSNSSVDRVQGFHGGNIKKGTGSSPTEKFDSFAVGISGRQPTKDLHPKRYSAFRQTVMSKYDVGGTASYESTQNPIHTDDISGRNSKSHAYASNTVCDSNYGPRFNRECTEIRSRGRNLLPSQTGHNLHTQNSSFMRAQRNFTDHTADAHFTFPSQSSSCAVADIPNAYNRPSFQNQRVPANFTRPGSQYQAELQSAEAHEYQSSALNTPESYLHNSSILKDQPFQSDFFPMESHERRPLLGRRPFKPLEIRDPREHMVGTTKFTTTLTTTNSVHTKLKATQDSCFLPSEQTSITQTNA